MQAPKNQMTLSECKMAFPKNSWFQPPRSRSGKVLVSEDNLQKYANQSIFLRKWTFIRFSSKLLWWIKRNPAVPEWVRCLFFDQVAGKLPDNLVMVQVAPGCFLSVKMELKTQDVNGNAVGRTHGKQKRYAESEQWFIARSPEQIENVLDKIKVMAERVTKCLQQQS